ncbi:MAG: DUF1641 domain-containing protein [Saprospiraceae bacterium]
MELCSCIIIYIYSCPVGNSEFVMETKDNVLPGPPFGTDSDSRLARIENTLSQLMSQLDQVPSLLSIATDSVDSSIMAAKQSGADIDEHIKSGIGLLTRLSDPKISTALNNLFDLIEQAPGLIALTTDAIDESMQKANQGSVKINDRIAGGISLLGRLSEPKMVKKVEQLIDLSDQLPGLVAMGIDSIDDLLRQGGGSNITFLKSVTEALSEAQAQAPAKIGGVFGFARAIKDSDRQKTLGLLMNVMKNLGKKL